MSVSECTSKVILVAAYHWTRDGYIGRSPKTSGIDIGVIARTGLSSPPPPILM